MARGLKYLKKHGAPGRDRTCDLRIRSRGPVMNRPSPLFAHLRVTVRSVYGSPPDRSRHRRSLATAADPKSHDSQGCSTQDSARAYGHVEGGVPRISPTPPSSTRGPRRLVPDGVTGRGPTPPEQ